MAHNYNLLLDLDFLSRVDHVISRERFSGARRFGLHPSEASAVANEDGYRYVVGGCHRAAAYRMLGVPYSNPPSIKSQYIFTFGDLIESMVRDKVKETGLFEANSVKFFYSKLRLSGELDIVIRHPEHEHKYIIVEVKSTYGYYNKKNLSKGKPKDANFCQIITYLWAGLDDPDTFTYAEDIIGGKLIYILRDSLDRFEFNITIMYDEKSGKHWPVINGKPDKRFSVEDIVRRYNILLKHMSNIYQELSQLPLNERTIENAKNLTSLPPRDYVRKYSDEEIEFLYKKGEISKTDYTKWKRNKNSMSNRPGHWMCSYCRWKDICWTKVEIDKHLNGEPQAIALNAL